MTVSCFCIRYWWRKNLFFFSYVRLLWRLIHLSCWVTWILMWIIPIWTSWDTIFCISIVIQVRNVRFAICQAVSYWNFATLFLVQYNGNLYGNCGGRSDTEQGLLRVLRVFSEYLGPSALSIIPPVLILIFHLSTRDATKSKYLFRSISSVTGNRAMASPTTRSPHSAIQCLSFQVTVFFLFP